MKQISIFFMIAGCVLAIIVPAAAEATGLLEKGLVIYAEVIAIAMIGIGIYYQKKLSKNENELHVVK